MLAVLLTTIRFLYVEPNECCVDAHSSGARFRVVTLSERR